MMDFSEARSFNDGIEFYGKDIIIIATRKDDKVKIEKSKSGAPVGLSGPGCNSGRRHVLYGKYHDAFYAGMCDSALL